MTQEKTCYNCDNMDFCGIYKAINDIASLLTVNLKNPHPTGENGYQITIGQISKNCKRFKPFGKEEKK